MKIKIIISILLLSPLAISAQTLDRNMCRKMAIENNINLEISKVKKLKTEYGIKSYRSHYFPKISATGSYLASSGELTENFKIDSPIPALVDDIDIEINAKLNNTYMIGLQLVQPIYMGGKIISANKMSHLADEIAEINIKKTSDEIIVESDEAYWQYIKIRELKNVSLKYQKVVEELIRNIENGIEVGMVANSNLLTAQTKLNEVKLMVRKAENGERLSKMNLCHIIGLPLHSNIEIVDSFNDELIKPTYVSNDISSRPEVKMLEKHAEIMKYQIRLARSEFLPNIGVIGSYNHVNGLEFYGLGVNKNFFSNDNSFSALINISIPIFSWGEGRSKIRSARADQKIANLQMKEAHELMTLEVNKSFNEFEEAYYRVELTKQSLELSTRNMEISKDNYETGMKTLAYYLEAQTMWQQAWSNYIDAKAMFQFNETYYLKSIGKIFMN